jgi:hypothetical protein
MLLWGLIACQDPFGADRHDLVGFRIAAIEVHTPTPDRAYPRLAMIVDDRPWTDSQPLLSWFWLEHAEELTDIDALTEPAGVGPRPDLFRVEGRPVLGLLARWGDEERRAFVTIADERGIGAVPTDVSVHAVDVEEADLADPARADIPSGERVQEVESAGFVRMHAEGVPADGRVRWMATAGSFFEVDGATADWAASDIVLDGGEVESSVPEEDGAVTVVALSTGTTESRFAATDLTIGPGGLMTRTHGRLLPGLALDGPAIVTLVADDSAPSGLSIADPEPSTADAPAGTSALECFVGVAGTFDPNWLLEMRCSREAIAGARVLVVPD